MGPRLNNNLRCFTVPPVNFGFVTQRSKRGAIFQFKDSPFGLHLIQRTVISFKKCQVATGIRWSAPWKHLYVFVLEWVRLEFSFQKVKKPPEKPNITCWAQKTRKVAGALICNYPETKIGRSPRALLQRGNPLCSDTAFTDAAAQHAAHPRGGRVQEHLTVRCSTPGGVLNYEHGQLKMNTPPPYSRC